VEIEETMGAGKLGPEEVMPPVAVFCDPAQPLNQAEAPANVDLCALHGALAEIDGYAPLAQRQRSIRDAYAIAAREAERALDRSDFEELEIPEPQSPVQLYFRTRTGTPSPEHAWWHVLRIVRDTVSDLMEAPMSGSDLCRLAAGMAEAIRPAATQARSEHAKELSKPEWPRTRPAEEIWLRRWIVAHQLHAMLNVHAAWALLEAAEELRGKEHHRAAECLDRAWRLVQGFTAARAQALSVPAFFYEETLRPTMLPPLTTAPLSGRMHLEYRAYRKALEDVLGLVPESSEELAATQPGLALARERLLEADLIEAERHVTGIEPLVGSDRSLIQTSKSTDNAITMLRRIRRQRASRASQFVRFADRDGTADADM
jgi:hypothetical protein